MSEDASRQTRSQKRALERDCPSADGKRLRSDTAEDSSGSETSGLLSGGEVKATIKLEVQTGDQPVDMSTSKPDVSPASPEDVIILSDSEMSSWHVNGKNHFQELDTQLLMKSSPQEREHVMKQLTEELRVEETKLILLKKLRQDQIQKDSNIQKPSPPMRTSTQPVTSGRASGTAALVAPVRGSGHVSKHGSQMVMPQLIRGAQPISVTTQQITGLRAQQQNSTSASPLLLTTRSTVPNIQNHKIIQPGLIRVANGSLLLSMGQSTGANLKPAASHGSDSPASRQAAAKLALRKQLEKTLMEIPPPKPPAAEFNFLPSAANNEFIYLLGLEEVVQNLLDSLGRGKQGVYAGLALSTKEPFCCRQCKTDFTCRWRKDKGGAIVCEQCMSSNQKKIVKAEHTNRLKAAFVKALQQEQEILQQIPVSSSSSSSAHRMKIDQTKHHLSLSLQQTHGRSSQPIIRDPAVIKQNAVQLSRRAQPSVTAARRVPHSFSPSSQLQNAVAAAALVSRAGKHEARQGSNVRSSARKPDPTTSSYRKQISVSSGVRMAYVNPSLSVQKSSSSSVERQREYLLDMIPSRSMTANTWK